MQTRNNNYTVRSLLWALRDLCQCLAGCERDDPGLFVVATAAVKLFPSVLIYGVERVEAFAVVG